MSYTFEEYQTIVDKTALYPGRKSISGLLYTALGLGETGEVQGKVKKILRDQNGSVTNENVEQLAKELGDVLWYVAAMASELGLSLAEVAEMNYEKLSGRKERGTIQGSGDDR